MSTAAKTPNYNLSQVAGSDIPDWITDYTSDMSKIDDALKGNADDIATVRPDEFSEESTYAAGDYCIKDNMIYKAKTAVEAGAFDISDWTATTIFNELSGVNQNIFSYKISSYEVNVTTQYSGTIGYIGTIDLSNQDDYPGNDKLIAAIPIGGSSGYDSSRVAIVSNVYTTKNKFVLNAAQSGSYYLIILYLYKKLV